METLVFLSFKFLFRRLLENAELLIFEGIHFAEMCLHPCVKLSPSFPMRILPREKKIVIFFQLRRKNKSFCFFLSAPEGIVHISLSGPSPLSRPDWLARLSVNSGGGA